jgi:D-xylose transport system substrate-binding protein
MTIGRPRLAVLCLSAALALALSACGSDDGGSTATGGGAAAGSDSTASDAGGKIAFLMPENKTTRYEAQDRPNFIKKVAQLCPKCEVIYQNATGDPARQQQQAEAAITEGAKVLVISAVDVASAGAIVQHAEQSNVKVIAYGRLIPDAPIDYYVSIDPYKVGQQQAQVQLDAAPDTKRVVMINGAPTDSNAKPYKDGALAVYKKAGVKVVKSYDTPDWSPDKAQNEMDQAITSLGHGGFDAVYSANDGMAGGAIASLKGASIQPDGRFVTGQDAELAGVQRILAGQQLMTVYQPLIQIAGTAAELAVPLAQGKQPQGIATDTVDNGAKQVPSKLLATVAITKDNIADTVVKDGFLKASDICAGSYAKLCPEVGIQ